MPTNWKLRELLKERGVNSASEISRIVLEQTGYQLSTQAVCDLLNRQPKMIRLETIQAICDAFYIRLSDVLEVFPSAAQKRKRNANSRQVNDSAKVLSERKCAVATPGTEQVDFAAFYPDARKFSSGNQQSVVKTRCK